MQSIYLKIPGKPIPKKTQRDKVKVEIDWKAKTYSLKRWRFYPQKEEVEEVRKCIRTQYMGEKLMGALFVSFLFHIEVPKSWNKKQRALALEGLLHPIGKPDTSNCAKFYEDCMNNVIYTDDSKIIWVNPIKKYDETSYTEITIRPFRSEDYQRFSGMVDERAN